MILKIGSKTTKRKREMKMQIAIMVMEVEQHLLRSKELLIDTPSVARLRNFLANTGNKVPKSLDCGSLLPVLARKFHSGATREVSCQLGYFWQGSSPVARLGNFPASLGRQVPQSGHWGTFLPVLARNFPSHATRELPCQYWQASSPVVRLGNFSAKLCLTGN